MELSDKKIEQLNKQPIVETRINRSEDGKWVVHKTTITDIKPVMANGLFAGFQMLTGTDILGYSKVLETLILRYLGKIIRVWHRSKFDQNFNQTFGRKLAF